MAEETSLESTAAEAGQADITSAPEPSVDSGAQGTSDASGEPASPQGPANDWWDTSGLDEPVAKRLKSAQAEYTRKSQEAARLGKEAERARTLEQEKLQLESAVRQVLEDPAAYELQRKQYLTAKGINHLEQAQPSQPPKPRREFKTVEDVLEHVEEREQWLANKLRQEYDTKLATEINRIATPIAKDRWQQADQSLRAKYPGVYEEYSPKVLQAVASGPYQALYARGMDEKQVLETTFKAIAYEDSLGRARQDALKSVEARKQAVTEKPKKSTPTSNGKPQTKDDIIADIRRSGFSFQ